MQDIDDMWFSKMGARLSSAGICAVDSIVDSAVKAERHRIFAAIDADYGAFLRDQGFQEWRRNRASANEAK